MRSLLCFLLLLHSTLHLSQGHSRHSRHSRRFFAALQPCLHCLFSLLDTWFLVFARPQPRPKKVLWHVAATYATKIRRGRGPTTYVPVSIEGSDGAVGACAAGFSPPLSSKQRPLTAACRHPTRASPHGARLRALAASPGPPCRCPCTPRPPCPCPDQPPPRRPRR